MSNDDNSSVSDSKDTTNPPTTNELGEKSAVPSVGEQVQAAEAEVNTNPTDKQKEAGNYKKGHVQIGTFNVTIEQPKGSVRRGVDKGGKKWKTIMQNVYSHDIDPHSYDVDPLEEGMAFKEQSLFACKQAIVQLYKDITFSFS